MFTKFWDKLAEGLAGTWNARILAPALAFWGGGLMAWGSKNDLDSIVIFVNKADVAHGIAAAIAGLFLIAVSSGLVEWGCLPILRLAEGYWPGVLKGLRFALAARLGRRLKIKEERWQALAKQMEEDKLDARGLEEYARLDVELARYPVAADLQLPTDLGNLLRAAEEYPSVRYGLDISVIWPRLWLTLSESTKKELTTARQALDERTQIMTWGLLFAAWTIWAWWAVIVALIAACVAYRGMLSAAAVYGDLLRATFDLHRFALYKSLNWPQPISPAHEATRGRELTQYLHRGFVMPDVQFKSF
jgi:hypothetical protein